MKISWWIAGLLLLLTTAGCKKETEKKPEEVVKTFPPPNWKGDETGRYPATMTAVVILPASLEAARGQGDQLAAFIGDECRGVGDVVKVETKELYFVMIRGLADEQSKITFKYYQAKTGYLYQTSTDLTFLVDAVYGTAGNPKVLALSPVK